MKPSFVTLEDAPGKVKVPAFWILDFGFAILDLVGGTFQ